jgi:hypothetical protein
LSAGVGGGGGGGDDGILGCNYMMLSRHYQDMP